MGKFIRSLIFIIVTISFVSVWGLRITHNVTDPYQFLGNDSFENLDEVRVIFRADPVNIIPNGTTNLNFVVENPTDNDHLISIVLIDVPGAFKVFEPGLEVEKRIQSNSSEKITFILKALEEVKPRTYWYAFGVVDHTLGRDHSVVNTTKQLGTYGGLNIVERLEGKESQATVPPTTTPIIATAPPIKPPKDKLKPILTVTLLVALFGVVWFLGRKNNQ